MKIKNWTKFQHFKDRKPPWVKLYRDLLDDVEWFELDPKLAKILVMLWLIASEEQDGTIPDSKKLAFRLRMTEKDINQALNGLSHWLEHDDIELISTRYQHDAPETETETELETKKEAEKETNGLFGFDDFWFSYDHKKAKPEAIKAWKRIKVNDELLATILHAVHIYVRNTPDKKFRKHPATWLNQKCWEDEILDYKPIESNKDRRTREFYEQIYGKGVKNDQFTIDAE